MSEHINQTEGAGQGAAADKLTEIVFILDRSGSMAGLESDTIGGFNALVKRNQEEPGRAVFSTILFNERTRVLHDRVDIAGVEPLTSRDYQPGGCTALLDAVGGAIEHVDMVQRYMPVGHKADHVLFAIATDGLENASHKYGYEQVKRMIESHTEKGWEFIFLGANIDVAAESARLGIRADRAMKYACDSEGTQAVYESMAQAAVNMRACGSVSAPDAARDWSEAVERDNKRRGGLFHRK